MSENPEPPSRLVRNLVLLIVAAALSAGVVFILWRSQPEWNYWQTLLENCRLYLTENPWALVLALAILPGLGFPLSAILILFGIVIGPLYGLPIACLLGVAAQSVCTIWTHALAAGPLRRLLTRYLLRRRELPQLTERNALQLAFIMRITPGIPYALQNVMLGIIGMKTKPYLLVSIPITAMWTVGFILTGGAIFEGNAGLALTGGLLLVALILITRMLGKRTKNYAR